MNIGQLARRALLLRDPYLKNKYHFLGSSHGQIESVLNEFNLMALVPHYHPQDIETRLAALQPMFLDIAEGNPGELFLLHRPDAFRRDSVTLRTAASHLYKNQDVPFAADDIHFPERASEVAFQNGVTFLLEEADGHLFPLLPRLESRHGHRITPKKIRNLFGANPWYGKIAGEFYRDRTLLSPGGVPWFHSPYS